MAENPIAVLFVCMGNICRSPAGEGIFKHYIAERHLTDQIRIDSAGTTDYHCGAPADHRMQEAASARGYTLDSIARQVMRDDVRTFDLVVAMDTDNLRYLEAMAGGTKAHIRLLGSFLPGQQGNDGAPSVPDPYYGGAEGFVAVLDMIEQACPGILAYCQRCQDQ